MSHKCIIILQRSRQTLQPPTSTTNHHNPHQRLRPVTKAARTSRCARLQLLQSMYSGRQNSRGHRRRGYVCMRCPRLPLGPEWSIASSLRQSSYFHPTFMLLRYGEGYGPPMPSIVLFYGSQRTAEPEKMFRGRFRWWWWTSRLSRRKSSKSPEMAAVGAQSLR